MTIPTQAAANTNNVTEVSPFNLTLPAYQNGDLVVAYVERNGTTQSFSAPAPWTLVPGTLLGPPTSGGVQQAVFYAWADSSTSLGSTVTITSTVATSQRKVSRVLVIRGADRQSGIVPIVVSSGGSGSASLSPTMPSLSLGILGTRDALWVATLIDLGQQPSAVPSGFTTQGSFVSTGLANNHANKSERASSQASGNWTTASTNYYSQLIAYIGPEPPSVNIPKDRIGPLGLLGIPIRRFKERSGEIAIGIIPDAPVPIVVPPDHIGPVGLLGIPVRRFKERSGEVQVGTIPIFPQPIIVPRDKIGPRGLLGIPIRKFKERSATPFVAPTVPVVPPPPPIVIPSGKLGPRGLLGIPVRKFKERSGEVAIGVNPYVPPSFTPAFFWTVT